MATKTDIISQALIDLGRTPINTLDTSDSAVQTLLSKYEFIKDDALASAPWSFCLKTADLVRATADPIDTNYQYSFYLPPDYIQLFEPPTLDYQIVTGGFLYANIPTFTCRYVHTVDESVFPAYFVIYLALYLAASCAMSVTKKSDIEKNLIERYMQQKIIACNRDSTAQAPRKVRSGRTRNAWYR